jgi:hypothetical protein
MWPISTRVNKPENDDPSIVEPVELAGATELTRPTRAPYEARPLCLSPLLTKE